MKKFVSYEKLSKKQKAAIDRSRRQTWGELTNEADIKSMNKLLDLLEEDDDVQEVYHNWDE